jgi:molybdate transport system permease protein
VSAISLWSALGLSVAAASLALLIDLVPAIWVARLLTRPQLRGRALLSAVVHLPVVLPPVVTGYLLLMLFSRRFWIGEMLSSVGLQVPFRFLGCVVAAAVVAFPFLVAALRGALESVDSRLEGIAQTLGDTPLRAFLRITLPLALPGLAAGAVLGFARALGEFGATIVLAGNIEGETRTLSLAVFSLLGRPGGESDALLFCLLAVLLSAVSLIVYEVLLRSQRRRRT